MIKKTEKSKLVKQVKKRIPNPTGKGGFKDRPEAINKNGRPTNPNSVSNWIKIFFEMSIDDFNKYKKSKTEKEMTMAELMAWNRVHESLDELRDFQEVVNRVEGIPKQSVDMTSGGRIINFGIPKSPFINPKDDKK